MSKAHKISELIGILDKKNEHFDLNVISHKKPKTASFYRTSSQATSKKSQPLSANQRNHARIQSKKIEELLAASGFQRQPELHPYFYLSELLQRNAFSIFDKDIKKYAKSLEKNQEIIGQILLKDLALERKITEGVIDKLSLSEMNKILSSQLAFIHTLKQNYEWRYTAYKEFIHSIDPGFSKKSISLSNKPVNTWQKIYALRVELNSVHKIEQKITCLLKLSDLTKKSNSHAIKREHGTTCGNLATYYMITGKFEKAIHYYQLALKLRKFFRPANYYTLQFNFVGLCLRNNQFELAYQSMLKVDTEIQKLPAVAFKWQLLKSMCYVLYGNEKEIKNILPTVPNKKDKRDYVYFYIIWSIYFARENKADTAIQMIETARSLSKRYNGEASLNTFIVLLKKYYLFTEKYGIKTGSQKTLESLNKIDLTEFSSGNILPLIWLNKYLKNIV